jgi:hypothetical protein
MQRHRGPREAGISLLEVLIAVSLLGVSFATIFSGLSAALRTTDRLDSFDRGDEFGGRAGALRSLSFRYLVAGENPVG